MEENKKRREKSGLRGFSRFCALQTLYKSEFGDKSISDILSSEHEEKEIVLTDSISLPSSQMDSKFLKELLNESEKHISEADKIIEENLSKNWNLNRIDPVAKCILRLGVIELIYFPKIPANVIFNEYIEIAKAFFEKSEVNFINGLLNKVSAVRELKPKNE